MSHGLELYRRIQAMGIVLSIDRDGRIAYDAPSGAMTSKLVDSIRAHRIELLEILESIDERAAIIEHDGGMSREDADRMALEEVIANAMSSPTTSSATRCSTSTSPAMADGRDSMRPQGLNCPYCQSRQLYCDPRGKRCRRCARLAWIVDGQSIVRADYEKVDLRI